MQRKLSGLTTQKFDLLICGGGIYGAWTAYDAALRGIKVAIVDKGDWASGTSSASSKLIHGGLRYLESFDFKLVKKALIEREMLLAAAPHRVWPLNFGVPVYKDSRIGRLQLKIGLMLYDFLAGKKRLSHRHRYFDKFGFKQQFPCLNSTHLKAGFTYTDAQTDDARLVLELIDGAVSTGAVCVNYCQINQYSEKDSKVCGAEVTDLLTNQSFEVTATQVVNTTGQWLTELQQAKSTCRLSKGCHLVLPKILEDQALLLTAKSDGRVFFMLPWYGSTIVGTTDTNYKGDINHLSIDQDEIEYLLQEANHYLENADWKLADILASYVGLRVLQDSDKSSPSSISRDWQIKTLENGMHLSVGGKITSAREDAACIVDLVMENLGNKQPCKTFAKDFPWKPSEPYNEWQSKQTAIAKKLGIDDESSYWLLRRQGSRVSELFKLIENQAVLAERIISTVPFIKAELVFCAEQEMVVHLEDILRRRIPILILSHLSKQQLTEIAETCGKVLAWDNSRINSEIEYCMQKYHQVNHPY